MPTVVWLDAMGEFSDRWYNLVTLAVQDISKKYVAKEGHPLRAVKEVSVVNTTMRGTNKDFFSLTEDSMTVLVTRRVTMKY